MRSAHQILVERENALRVAAISFLAYLESRDGRIDDSGEREDREAVNAMLNGSDVWSEHPCAGAWHPTHWAEMPCLPSNGNP